MLKPAFFSTESNNYVHSFAKNQIIYSHQIIYHLYKNEENKKSDEDFYKNIEDGTYTLSEIEYYKKKYEFLKKSGFFSSIKRDA